MRVLLAACLVFASACAPPEVKIGSARLPEADGTIDVPEGVTIEVGKAPIPSHVTGPVRLAIDGEIPYQQVVDAVHAVRAAGGKPYLLVTYRNRLYALPDPEPLTGVAIRLRAQTDGKACVSPPDNEEATCVSRIDQKRIDRAFVRQVLAQAVRDYGLKRIRVVVDPALPWSDAVRAIDGARTCCGVDSGVIVSVEPS